MEIFTVWVGFHSFRTDNALKKHESLCGDNDYCHVEMPTEDNNALKYNHGEKSIKVPFTNYADLECLLIKQQSCQNNPNESYTERKAMHEPCGYSLDLVISFSLVIQTKANTGFIEEGIALKSFAVIQKSLQQK